MADYIKKIGNKEIKVDWSNIDNKIDFLRSVYIQDEEPVDAPEGSLWIDTNDILGPFSVAEEVEF